MGKYDVKQEVTDKYSLRGRVFHKLRDDILSGNSDHSKQGRLCDRNHRKGRKGYLYDPVIAGRALCQMGDGAYHF